MKKKIAAATTFGFLLALAVGVKWFLHNFTVNPPNYPPIENPVWLNQNWSQDQRHWFHHADQGTQTFGIPYEWFTALEQPPFSSSSHGLLSDSAYLDRYGFIPSSAGVGKP